VKHLVFFRILQCHVANSFIKCSCVFMGFCIFLSCLVSIVLLLLWRINVYINSSFLPPQHKSMEAWLGWSDSLLPFKTTIVWFFASQESHENCCHQMSDFKAKMHQIRFRPRWGSLQRSPDLLAGFKGPYF